MISMPINRIEASPRTEMRAADNWAAITMISTPINRIEASLRTEMRAAENWAANQADNRTGIKAHGHSKDSRSQFMLLIPILSKQLPSKSKEKKRVAS